MRLTKSNNPTALGKILRYADDYMMEFSSDTEISDVLMSLIAKSIPTVGLDGEIRIHYIQRFLGNIFFVEGQEFDALDLEGPGDEELIILCWK